MVRDTHSATDTNDDSETKRQIMRKTYVHGAMQKDVMSQAYVQTEWETDIENETDINRDIETKRQIMRQRYTQTLTEDHRVRSWCDVFQ